MLHEQNENMYCVLFTCICMIDWIPPLFEDSFFSFPFFYALRITLLGESDLAIELDWTGLDWTGLASLPIKGSGVLFFFLLFFFLDLQYPSFITQLLRRRAIVYMDDSYSGFQFPRRNA